MADEEKMAGVESSIADALAPFAPNFGKRPRVYPVVDQEAGQAPNAATDFVPVRTLTQFLVDIEKVADMTHDKVRDLEKNLAEILKVTNERLARIENSIGVR